MRKLLLLGKKQFPKLLDYLVPNMNIKSKSLIVAKLAPNLIIHDIAQQYKWCKIPAIVYIKTTWIKISWPTGAIQDLRFVMGITYS